MNRDPSNRSMRLAQLVQNPKPVIQCVGLSRIVGRQIARHLPKIECFDACGSPSASGLSLWRSKRSLKPERMARPRLISAGFPHSGLCVFSSASTDRAEFSHRLPPLADSRFECVRVEYARMLFPSPEGGHGPLGIFGLHSFSLPTASRGQ